MSFTLKLNKELELLKLTNIYDLTCYLVNYIMDFHEESMNVFILAP